ncbi:ILVBL protein, partial [Alectura lathami]|nr:ILVBL protein [Alectura lathami]
MANAAFFLGGWRILGCRSFMGSGRVPALYGSRQRGFLPVYSHPKPTSLPAGRIGVAAVTAGPGVTNAVTAVKNAQMAESPLLLIGGRGALQDIDQLSLFRTLCKECVAVRAVRQIVPALRRAIATAQSGTPGPVFVELPIDVLYPFHVVEKEVGGTRSARGLRAKLVQWYLQNYVRNLFAGAWEPQDITPLPMKVPLATEDEVGFVPQPASGFWG